MIIKIEKLSMTNFKGVKQFALDVCGDSVIISGDNGTGKTSIFDAWLWLLFDMDSRGNKGAEAAKTTAGTDFVHHLTHEVFAEISVDDKRVTLKKLLEENWVKPRGKADQEFSGNVSKYWVDDVPRQAKDFQSYISSLIPADLFKIVSDPLYFSEVLPWRERLNMLGEISGGITEEDIASGDQALEMLLVKMGDKSIADYRAMVQEQIRRLNNEINGIPARIDECRRAIPEEADFSETEKQIKDLMRKIEDLEREEMSSAERMKPILAAQDEIYRLKRERANLINQITDEANQGRHAVSLEIQKIVAETRSLQQTKNSLMQTAKSNADAKADLEAKNADLRKEYVEIQTKIRQVSAEEFNAVSSEENCPTCGQRLPEETISAGIEKLRASFEDHRKSEIAALEVRLRRINESGQSNKATLAAIEEGSSTLMESIQKAESEIVVKEARLAVLRDTENNSPLFLPNMAEADPRVKVLDDKILQLEILTAKTPEDTIADVRRQKSEIRNQIDLLNRKLSGRGIKEQMEKRIEELEKDLKTKGTKKTALEGDIFQTERFVRARTEKLEGKINGMFSKVGFKLFSEQINGGLTETCEAVVNNTTFSKANTAGQINAGMDIIRTISRFKGIYVPVFVDHLESINDLLPIPTQVIGLLVGTEQTLNVRTKEKKEVA